MIATPSPPKIPLRILLLTPGTGVMNVLDTVSREKERI